jgi:arsenite methyltransferase
MKKSFDEQKIKNVVKDRYASLVRSGASSCCDKTISCCAPKEKMKGNLVKSAGYSDDELAVLPESSVENAYGCGNPLAFVEVAEGQTVVDIGSGAGIDCFIASKKVGPKGRVIGIDMTPEMIKKATENAITGGYTNVEFRLGDAEAMPVNDASADWIISNCVINLSPDKPRVFAEIARVLKSGGRFSISDVVLGDDLPEDIAGSMHAWTGCIAGAIKETEYTAWLRAAGLREIKIMSRIVYDDTVLKRLVSYYDLPIGKDRFQSLLQKISGNIWSAKIGGMK